MPSLCLSINFMDQEKREIIKTNKSKVTPVVNLLIFDMFQSHINN